MTTIRSNDPRLRLAYSREVISMPDPKVVPLSVEPDPFDLESLKISQDFGSQIGVKKILTNIPVRRPNKQKFIRVREGENWRCDVLLLEDRENREHFLIAATMHEALATEAVPVTVFAGIDRSKNLFLWPIRLPVDGRDNRFWQSARDAAAEAMESWVRVVPNVANGCYDLFRPENQSAYPPPEWPEEYTFRDLLRLGFRHQLIDGIDHLIVKQLRGLV